MDFRQLRCFLAVAETLHFRRAAQMLHMSQPPLSAAIMSLEEALGVKLLERSTRSVKLTPAGIVLRAHGDEIMAHLARAGEETRQVGKGLAGRLSVGFVGIATSLGLAQCIRRYRAESADVLVSLEELATHKLVEGLIAGHLDIAFLRVFDSVPHPLVSQSFAEEPYWLAIPEAFELASRKRIQVQHLHGQSLLFFPRHFHPQIHDAWLSAFHRAEASPHLIQEARSLQTELALVAAGMGIALVTESVAKEAREAIVFRKLSGPAPRVKVHVAWHPDTISAARDVFLSLL